MDKHLKFSLVKSGLRLLACLFLVINIVVAAVLLAGAEIFGVIEEL